jgi:acetyl esterase/lipase
MEKRAFLKMSALAIAGVTFGPARGASLSTKYDPKAKLDLKVIEVPYRKNAAGRELLARVYQPQGAGPFPVLLDLHGGAWNRKDRKAEEPMDRAIAESGVLVVAIDMTIAKEAPYPACVQDAHYGVRWLKRKAAGWKGDASTIGVFGSSSGGHVAELIGMRPRDPRYAVYPLKEAPDLDASLRYVATRSPISNTFARYQNAVNRKRENMMKNNTNFFRPFDTIHEANPQEILERREKVNLLPLLVMQGALDDNVLAPDQKQFTETYRAAGGDVRFELFEGCEHEWVAEPGPQTDRAHEMVKEFIAQQLAARRSA